MVEIYVKLIRQGLKTLDDVPLKYWEQVKVALEEADGKCLKQLF